MADPVLDLPLVHVWPVSKEVDRAELAAFVRAVIAQHPDDLARAIREGVDARLRDLSATLRQNLEAAAMPVPDPIRYLCAVINTMPPAPREPAQERQDAPADRDYESGNDLGQGDQWQPARWLRHYAACHGTNDGARRKLFKAADALDRLATTQQAGGADPLLPGLRAARERIRSADDDFETFADAWIAFRSWLDAEIARREGGA